VLVEASTLMKVKWDSKCLPFPKKEELEKEVSGLPEVQRRERGELE
jgi:hypothetical protein